jgi:sugar phosphate permease
MVLVLAFILFLSNLLNYIDRQLFSALFPVLTSLYRLTDMEVGLLGSAFTFSYLLAAPVTGILSQRWNPKKILGAGILLFSIGMGVCAFSNNVQGLFAGRMLTGVGEAALLVVAPQIFGRQNRTGLRTGLFLSAMPIGGAIGFAMAIRSGGVPVSKILFLPVLPGLVLGIIFFFLKFDFPSKRTSFPDLRASVAVIVQRKNLLSVVGLQISNTFVLGGMAIWISLYLTREKHLSVASGSLLTGLSLVTGGFLGMILMGMVCDRIGPGNLRSLFHLILSAQVVSFVGILVVLFGRSEPMLFLGLLLASIGLFGINVPLLVAIIRICEPAVWGMVFGISVLLTHLFGDLPSSSLIGLLSAHIGLSGALFLLLPSQMLLGLLILFRTLKIVSAPAPLDFRT